MTNSNRKCGEITFCTQVGKRVYVLNCIYCSQICLQWEMFINHLEQEHDGHLNLEPIVQPQTSKMSIKMEVPEMITDEPTSTPVHNNKKRKTLDESLPSSAFDDPLESENSASEMCYESSIKIEQEEFETEENSSEMNTTSVQRRRESTMRYREKLRQDPERYQEYRNKAAERMRKHREKISQLAKSNAELLQEKREKDRLRQKRLREKKRNSSINSNLLKEKREKDRLRQKRLREQKRNSEININELKEKREKDRIRQRRLREKRKRNAKEEKQIDNLSTCQQTFIITEIKETYESDNCQQTLTTAIKQENID